VKIHTHNTQISLNKQSLENPMSTSNQSSKPCALLQYPSKKKKKDNGTEIHGDCNQLYHESVTGNSYESKR